MKIGIVGLGLIGGSLAMAAKGCGAKVLGADSDPKVMQAALQKGAVDQVLTEDNLPQCDFLIIALYPDDGITYLRAAAPHIAPHCTVVDCCGVKEDICRVGHALAEQYGFAFIGGHPMAGSEQSGFGAARANLFAGASMVLTPHSTQDRARVQAAEQLFLQLGFGRITYATPQQHDRVIAFTSQLPHVLANAYIKSPTAGQHKGFTGGSYQDISRVAYLNEEMWTRLFLLNAKALLPELNDMITHLQQYRDAIAKGDRDGLWQLLHQGKIKKIQAEEGSTCTQ